MFIDPHVHCRDEEQAHKETIAHALKVAERAGFTAIFDMPNVARPVTTKERVMERLELAKRAESPVWFGAYMALTSDPDQIKGAVEAYYSMPQVVGFKLYAGHSTGNIGITIEEQQRAIYKTLAEEKYNGVIAVHCEKESLMKNETFNPLSPITHAFARPSIAEVESAKDQVNFALEYGFKGTLHIAHVSVPETVGFINSVQGLEVTCGVCPHHVLLDYSIMEQNDGLLYKMNPPLRSPEERKVMLDLLMQNKITWIETDHAPHTLEEKLSKGYASGVPNLHKYPKFIRWLRARGMGEEQIKDLTFNNINKIFGLGLKPRECSIEYDLEKEYAYDPYKNILNFKATF
jgi:dihydroorotase